MKVPGEEFGREVRGMRTEEVLLVCETEQRMVDANEKDKGTAIAIEDEFGCEAIAVGFFEGFGLGR